MTSNSSKPQKRPHKPRPCTRDVAVRVLVDIVREAFDLYNRAALEGFSLQPCDEHVFLGFTHTGRVHINTFLPGGILMRHWMTRDYRPLAATLLTPERIRLPEPHQIERAVWWPAREEDFRAAGFAAPISKFMPDADAQGFFELAADIIRANPGASKPEIHCPAANLQCDVGDRDLRDYLWLETPAAGHPDVILCVALMAEGYTPYSQGRWAVPPPGAKAHGIYWQKQRTAQA